jgi:Bacterial mobilisation protein (MobC)
MIRYREAEAVAVRERASVCGLPLARYVREVSLGAAPRERRHRSVDALIRQLARIGSNLNQLAHEAHARDQYPMEARVDATLAELRTAIRQVASDSDGPRPR